MDLGLVRRDCGEHAAQAKRFVAELRPQPIVAARRRVSFVEDEVDDSENRGEPLRKFFASWRLIGQPRFRQRALGAHDALGDRRFRLQEGPGDLAGRQAADHPQRQRGTCFAREERMTGGENEPQQLVADVIVQRGIPIGHGLLLGHHVIGDQLVFALEHPAAPQMIEGAALGGRHQPGAGPLRHAHRGPAFQSGQQRFLRQIFGQRHIAEHPRQAGDQPGLLDPPDGEDRLTCAGGRHDRGLYWLGLRLKGRPPRMREARTLRPIPASDPCGAA